MQAQRHQGVVTFIDGFNGRRCAQLYECDRKRSDSYAAYTRRTREGVHGCHFRRDEELRQVLADLHRLAGTQQGQFTVGKQAQVHPLEVDQEARCQRTRAAGREALVSLVLFFGEVEVAVVGEALEHAREAGAADPLLA